MLSSSDVPLSLGLGVRFASTRLNQKLLPKSPASTTKIWSLHVDPDSFWLFRAAHLLNEKVNSVTLPHLTLFWLGVLVTYASNYSSFLLNPEVKPSSQYASTIVGQSLLNGDTGSEHSGTSIVTGIFSVYLTQLIIIYHA